MNAAYIQQAASLLGVPIAEAEFALAMLVILNVVAVENERLAVTDIGKQVLERLRTEAT